MKLIIEVDELENLDCKTGLRTRPKILEIIGMPQEEFASPEVQHKLKILSDGLARLVDQGETVRYLKTGLRGIDPQVLKGLSVPVQTHKLS